MVWPTNPTTRGSPLRPVYVSIAHPDKVGIVNRAKTRMLPLGEFSTTDGSTEKPEVQGRRLQFQYSGPPCVPKLKFHGQPIDGTDPTFRRIL